MSYVFLILSLYFQDFFQNSVCKLVQTGIVQYLYKEIVNYDIEFKVLSYNSLLSLIAMSIYIPPLFPIVPLTSAPKFSNFYNLHSTVFSFYSSNTTPPYHH